MTSHLNSHGTIDIKPEMLSGVQTGNGTPHDKYNIHGIAHGRTNRKDIFVQRGLVQNFLSILELCQETFPACCLVRFAAFFWVVFIFGIIFIFVVIFILGAINILRSSSFFWGGLHFWCHPHICSRLHLLCHLHFWACLHFLVIIMF